MNQSLRNIELFTAYFIQYYFIMLLCIFVIFIIYQIIKHKIFKHKKQIVWFRWIRKFVQIEIINIISNEYRIHKHYYRNEADLTPESLMNCLIQGEKPTSYPSRLTANNSKYQIFVIDSKDNRRITYCPYCGGNLVNEVCQGCVNLV